jgi:hypothetical protein
VQQSNDIALHPPRLGRAEDGRNELRITVDEAEVFFRAASPLAETVDGAVCAFFLPALSAKRRLASAAPVDRTLRDNLEEAAGIAARFWGYSGPLPEAPLTDRVAAGSTGVFFTGGVDSFYTLRTNLDRIRCLVNVHGFDIMLSDVDRFTRSNALLARVADLLSLEYVSVESNLRAHPVFNSTNWEVTHIAALASVAHALAPVLGRVYVGSSDVPPPWGSHPSLDKLWSSAAVTLINDEIDVSRLDKVKVIADWPPVAMTLKVCWENRSAELNCGVCEKCVRTQAQFAVAGRLGDLQTFPPGDLVQRIDALRWIKRSLFKQWGDIYDALEDQRLRRAIERLLRRSKVLEVPIELMKSAGLTRGRLRRLSGGRLG